MEYEIIINRGGEEIMRSGIEADQVIDLLLVGKNQETEEEEDEEEMPRKKSAPKEMDTTAKKQRKPVTCSNCGGTGHQSRTCTKESSESKPVPVEDVPDGAMSVQTYLAVRKQKHEGRSMEDVVDGMEIDEDEVKAAFASLTYSGYLVLRK